MSIVAEAYKSEGHDFPKHAVAITMPGSELDRTAIKEKWLARFPMFDWIGGRTSVLSAVGLVPAALQGLDVDGPIAGAAACDQATRLPEVSKNPFALMALMWYHLTDGAGKKDMVVLPYKDRLLLFSRYLQQLVMSRSEKSWISKANEFSRGCTMRPWRSKSSARAFGNSTLTPADSNNLPGQR